MKIFRKKNCSACGPIQTNHIQQYIDSLIAHAFPKLPGASFLFAIGLKIERFLENLLIFLGLLKLKPYGTRTLIPPRTSVFIAEGIKRGFSFFVLEGPRGHVNRFRMKRGGVEHRFEGLPRAEFLSGAQNSAVDDKAFVKETLSRNGIPVPEGKCFSILKAKSAVAYGKRLGFPLVVKPRSGSMDQHVFLNIRNEKELRKAIWDVFSYEPYCVVEKFLEGMRTYRADVVDFSNIAVVQRIPANVVGDGKHSIQELIDIKNADPRRGPQGQNYTPLFHILVDETTDRLLAEQGYMFSSVPEFGVRVFLQEKVLRDFGTDLAEVTGAVHPDNMELFQNIAQLFNTRLVGIDFLSQDISRSWKDGGAAVVELNSLPYIDMHHFPTEGEPVNVAGFVCDLVEKYY